MSPQTGGQIINLQSKSETPSLNEKYRRNGKLQSCEPCRKSKLRCDHVIPVCNRCVKRKGAEKCVYHPNPLTKTRQRIQEEAPPTPSSSTNDRTSPVLLTSIESSDPSTSSTQTPEVVPRRRHQEEARARTRAPAPEVNRAASAPPSHSHQYDGGPARVNPGFLGDTNFMCIFSENLGKLGVAELEGPRLPRLTIPHDQITHGTQILSFLQDASLVHDFVNRFFDIGDGVGNICIEPIMKQWLLKLWAHHADTLKNRNPEKLRRLSELLWRNTLTTVSVTADMDYRAWALQATGMNIRWEVIGIIAALVGQCANTLSRGDLLLTQHDVSKSVLARKMSEIASTCLNFCRDCEALDDLFVWLLVENFVLTASIKGDGSYAVYRESGEFVSAVVAMGLHRDVNQGKVGIPFFLEQTRRRMVLGAYSQDISMSAYLGRPPRLSYRYCHFVLPLDVPDTHVVAGNDEIARVVSHLDENGFNTVGKITRATWMRTWLGSSMRREEILDLALGRYNREEIVRRAAEIQKKSREYWTSLPAFIRDLATTTPNDHGDGSEKKRPLEAMLKLSMRQSFHANELLLQRVLIRKTGASWEKLVEVACLIFEDILLISKRHDLALVFQSDISQLLAIQGLRSAAVLAVELLKQEQLPNYPKIPLLPRSKTIQELSVFAARLGDVDPSAGAFTVCDQGRKVITRILDKILTPPGGLLEQSVTAHVQYDHQQQLQPQQNSSESIDMSPFQNESIHHQEWHIPEPLDIQMGDANIGINVPFLVHDNDFMQWLENVDWETPM